MHRKIYLTKVKFLEVLNETFFVQKKVFYYTKRTLFLIKLPISTVINYL